MEEYIIDRYFVCFLNNKNKKLVSKGFTFDKTFALNYASKYKHAFVHTDEGEILYSKNCTVSYDKEAKEYIMVLPDTWYEIIINKIKSIWK